jgi:hypothetical protein
MFAVELGQCMVNAPVGSDIGRQSTRHLQSVMEVLITQALCREHAEWQGESIDGFRFASVAKTGDESVGFLGLCILITDQTVAPVNLDVVLWPDRKAVRRLRIRLGEAGGGPLGISGPSCTSAAAGKLLVSLPARFPAIEWIYDVTIAGTTTVPLAR